MMKKNFLLMMAVVAAMMVAGCSSDYESVPNDPM